MRKRRAKMPKYIGVVSETYSYMVEVEAVNLEDAQTFMSEVNLTMLKPYRVDFKVEEVKEA
jgi:hypothetical protein